MPASPAPPLVGAHVSVAGGVSRAVERAEALGMTAFQIFTGSSRAWKSAPLDPSEAAAFRSRLADSPIGAAVAHASYLLNLATPDDALREKSEAALAAELLRCEELSIRWLVLHPGSAMGGDREEAIDRTGAALRRVLRATAHAAAGVLVENAAGQGDSVATTVAEIEAILEAAGGDGRLGVCLDTCHAFAAGIDLVDPAVFDGWVEEFDRRIGLDRLHAVHVNDSKKPLGCRVDRHEHVGRGAMGLAPFRRLVNHPVLSRRPLLLETPKGAEDGEDLDAVNLRVLRGLAGPAKRARRSRA